MPSSCHPSVLTCAGERPQDPPHAVRRQVQEAHGSQGLPVQGWQGHALRSRYGWRRWRLLRVGKRRYDRKQSGYGGQTKPVFHKKAKTTKKIVLRLECSGCKTKHQLVLKRCKHFELGGEKKTKVTASTTTLISLRRVAFPSKQRTNKPGSYYTRALCRPRPASMAVARASRRDAWSAGKCDGQILDQLTCLSFDGRNSARTGCFCCPAQDRGRSARSSEGLKWYGCLAVRAGCLTLSCSRRTSTSRRPSRRRAADWTMTSASARKRRAPCTRPLQRPRSFAA